MRVLQVHTVRVEPCGCAQQWLVGDERVVDRLVRVITVPGLGQVRPWRCWRDGPWKRLAFPLDPLYQRQGHAATGGGTEYPDVVRSFALDQHLPDGHGVV